MVQHHVLSDFFPVLQLVHFVVSVRVQHRPAQELGQSLRHKKEAQLIVCFTFYVFIHRQIQINRKKLISIVSQHYRSDKFYLHELLILIIKRLSIFSVVKRGHTHYLFFFVDNWQRENVFYGPATAVKRLSLQNNNNNNNKSNNINLNLINTCNNLV